MPTIHQAEPTPSTSRNVDTETAFSLLETALLEEDSDDNDLNVTFEAQPELNSSRLEQKMSTYEDYGKEGVDESAGSYELIHSSFLSSIFRTVHCPYCDSPGLDYRTVFTRGLASKITVSCKNCERDVITEYTSPRVNRRRDINYRFVLGSKECGVGHPKLMSLFAVMNIRNPLHHHTYTQISSEIHKAATNAADKVMKTAAEKIAERCKDGTYESDRISATGCPVTNVSYDGTWQKRGHSSHNGVGVLIDANAGLVVDTETISNFCQACAKGPKPESPIYAEWKVKHAPMCQLNYEGSSNSMEMEAAKRIFSRSIEKNGLIYGTMICDGDAKSYEKVKITDGYDVQVVKEDCINHISKRMFNGLETLKKTRKAELNRKVTVPMITNITNTYAKFN